MRVEVFTVFLTMQLTIALMRFMELETPHLHHWFIFIYFIINNIRLFEGDVRVAKKIPSVEKKAVRPYRALSFIVSISSKFMFIIMAYYINSPIKFFGYFSLAILLDTFWIWNLRESIDPKKDTGEPSLRDVFRSWITLDVIVAVLLVGVCLFGFFSPGKPEIVDWAIIIGLIFCYAMLMFDFAWNYKLYFE